MVKKSNSAKRDGETIRILPSGLEIVRRKKHEAINLSKYSVDERKKLTNKIFGSKFAPAWNIERVAGFIAAQATANAWDSKTGSISAVVRLSEKTGTANGMAVSAIRVVSDGRYLHAYPVKE